MKRNILISAALFVLVTGFWAWRTHDYEFLRLDDPPYASANPHVQAGFTWESVKWATCIVSRDEYWHPVTWLSLMADAEFAPGGDLPALSRVMHLHNAAVQGLCAALLFLLIMAWLGKERREPAIPALLALVWAVHPLRAECVCWVTERKELLCTLYSLVTLLVWSGRMRLRRVAAVVAFACALMSKSVAVTLPAVLVALDLVRLRDWRRVLRENGLAYAVMAVLCAGTVFATVVSQTEALEGNQAVATLHIRLANGFGAYAVHLSRIFAPYGLYFYRQFTNCVDWTAFAFGLLLCGAMAGAVLAFLRRMPRRESFLTLGFLAAAWIGVGLLPMCGVLRVGIEMNPDRFGHWIGVGFTVLAAVALVRGLSPRMKRVALGVLVPVTLLCGYAGWTYAGFFQNSFELFARTLEHDANHPAAYVELAYELLTRYNDRDGAIECYERASVLCRDDAAEAMHVSLLSDRGRPEDFRRIREICARVEKDHSLDDRGAALSALGAAHMNDHEWEEAISCLTDAVDRQRKDAKLKTDPRPVEENRLRIAMCLCNLKRYAAARPIVNELLSATLPKVRTEARRIDQYLAVRGF